MEFNRKVIHVFKYKVTKYLISQYVIRQSSSTINTLKKKISNFIYIKNICQNTSNIFSSLLVFKKICGTEFIIQICPPVCLA